MAETSASLPQTVRPAAHGPWTQRLIQALPGEPVWTGLGIAVVVFALGLVWFAVLGVPGGGGLRSAAFWRDWGAGSAVMGLLIGYGPTAMAYSQRARERALAELRPILRADAPPPAALLAQAGGFDARWLRRMGLFSVVAGALLRLVDPDAQGFELEPGYVWNRVTDSLAAWMIGRAFTQEIRAAQAFSILGRTHVRVDLWEPAGFAPFVARGLQSVLVWSLAASIAALNFLAGGWAGPVGGVAVALLGVAIGAVVLPVYGAHQALGAAKRAELAGLRAEIQAQRDVLVGPASEAAREAALRLPALVALESRVATARIWPFELSSYARFALYLGIGLVSWVGAAMVERLLGRLLE